MNGLVVRGKSISIKATEYKRRNGGGQNAEYVGRNDGVHAGNVVEWTNRGRKAKENQSSFRYKRL